MKHARRMHREQVEAMESLLALVERRARLGARRVDFERSGRRRKRRLVGCARNAGSKFCLRSAN